MQPIPARPCIFFLSQILLASTQAATRHRILPTPLLGSIINTSLWQAGPLNTTMNSHAVHTPGPVWGHVGGTGWTGPCLDGAHGLRGHTEPRADSVLSITHGQPKAPCAGPSPLLPTVGMDPFTPVQFRQLAPWWPSLRPKLPAVYPMAVPKHPLKNPASSPSHSKVFREADH